MSGMVEPVARLLFPAALAVAMAIFVRGYADVGDGFSAGLLAALGATVLYFAFDRATAARASGARWGERMALAGLALALVTVLAPVLVGAHPVTHAPAPGEPVRTFGALELHTALLFDLGVALVVYGFVVATLDRLLAGTDTDTDTEGGA